MLCTFRHSDQRYTATHGCCHLPWGWNKPIKHRSRTKSQSSL